MLLFWKHCNLPGAVAVIVSGTLTVVLWDDIPLVAGQTIGGAMNVDKKSKAAPFLVATAAMLWGALVFFVRKLSAAGFSAMDIVCIRAYGSSFFLAIGLGLLKRPLLRVKLKDCWCFVGTGVFSIVFFSYCYFQNVEVSSAAVASILMYTSPVWVTLLSAIFFKEQLTKRKLLGLILALVGCVLVSGITNGLVSVSLQGILLGLGSGIGYGLYTIFGQFALNKGYHPMTVAFYTFLFACIGLLPFVSVSSILNKLLSDPELWLYAICIAFFATCVAFSLYTIGLQYLEPGRAAVLATLEPIVATLLGVVFYQEKLTAVMVAGIVLVLVASVLISRK